MLLSLQIAAQERDVQHHLSYAVDGEDQYRDADTDAN